jgi:predicted ATP-dependent serine protease
MNSMHVSLCTSCGHVVKNWLGTCVICRSKNSMYIQAVDPFELDRKVKRARAQCKPNNSQSGSSSFLIISMSLIIVAGACFNPAGKISTVVRLLSPPVASSR